MIATWKRLSLNDPNRSVTTDYYRTDWLHDQQDRQALPTALRLDTLYEKTLTAIIESNLTHDVSQHLYNGLENSPMRIRFAEQMRIAQVLAESAAIRAKLREVKSWQSAVRKTRQFNRRVEAHQRLKASESELHALLKPLSFTS